MCLYGGAGVQFERELNWNCTGEVQAQLTVDQAVSTVPARVAKVAQVASLKVGICKSDYLWYVRVKLESASWTLWWNVVSFDVELLFYTKHTNVNNSYT